MNLETKTGEKSVYTSKLRFCPGTGVVVTKIQFEFRHQNDCKRHLYIKITIFPLKCHSLHNKFVSEKSIKN